MLRAEIVLKDCRYAHKMLESVIDEQRFRVYWAASLSLLRAVGHVLQKVDAETSPEVREAVDQAWKRWGDDRDVHALFWEFIEGERNLVLKKYFNIGFAADTPNGLVVPVVRDVDKKGVVQIAQESGELAKKARDGKLGPADMSGGCFSISSLGGIGGTAFTPIVNAPEVAILGVSKSSIQPVWNGKEFAPKLMLPLSLSYDHRVIDGALAARFTTYLSQVLADMRRVLL